MSWEYSRSRLAGLVLFCSLAALWLVLQAERMRLGIAWEDAYHHWLVAAAIAQTGADTDPLTGGRNGWLPLYHWLAAAVLSVAGWHNLRALEWSSAALTLITGGLLTWRWGPLWAALFLFNPITILNGSLSVSEPLTTLLVVAGILCWEHSRSLYTFSGGMFWSLAALCDRGSWPLVVLAAGWQLWQGGRVRAVGLIPLLALGVGIGLTRRDLVRTAAWAAIDQGSLAWSDRLGQLATFSWQPLTPLLVLAFAGSLFYWRHSARLLVLLCVGYMAVIITLVGGGGLTGSSRYYLVLVALLTMLVASWAWASRWIGPLLGGLVCVALVLSSRQYLDLWPRWVILNRPSVEAGKWLARQAQRGLLLTDSPVIAYYSTWPTNRISGSAATGSALPGQTSYVTVIPDQRYERVYPLLGRYPSLLSGDTPPGWLRVWSGTDWTVRYGAKPVEVFRITSA